MELTFDAIFKRRNALRREGIDVNTLNRGRGLRFVGHDEAVEAVRAEEDFVHFVDEGV